MMMGWEQHLPAFLAAADLSAGTVGRESPEP